MVITEGTLWWRICDPTHETKPTGLSAHTCINEHVQNWGNKSKVGGLDPCR